MTSVGILGADGRMGRALIRKLADEMDLQLGAAVVPPGSERVGDDAGELAGSGRLGIALIDSPQEAARHCEVLVDFTLPEALDANLAAALAQGVPLVIGTTGLSGSQQAAIQQASGTVPLVQAANYSSGITLMHQLVAMAARALGEDYDVEIVEAHHRHKQDAPSGTALALGETAAAARSVSLDTRGVRSRDGITGARQPGDIGFQTLRGGDIVGEHTVMLAGDGERIELTHRASSRDTFAMGALRAARWLMGQKPGLYNMEDVLGLRHPVR